MQRHKMCSWGGLRGDRGRNEGRTCILKEVSINACLNWNSLLNFVLGRLELRKLLHNTFQGR